MPEVRKQARRPGRQAPWVLLRTAILAAVFLSQCWATPFGAPPADCAVDSLSGYIGLGAGGCMLGGEVAVFDFAFTLGAGLAINPGQITVTPAFVGNTHTLRFTSPSFAVRTGGLMNFTIAYSVDPHPILLAFEDEMFVSSAVAPGFVAISTDICIGALFMPGCAGTPRTLTLLHNGAPVQLLDVETFAPQSLIGVNNQVTLDATAGGSANLTALENRLVSIPEPHALLLVSGFLGVLCARRKRAVSTRSPV